MKKLINKIKRWLIHKLGGYTVDELNVVKYEEIPVSRHNIIRITWNMDLDWEQADRYAEEHIESFLKDRVLGQLRNHVVIRRAEDPIMHQYKYEAHIYIVEENNYEEKGEE